MENIKIQQFTKQSKSFQQGDIVIAKCNNYSPWPAIIRNFYGYGNNQTEFYTVDFFNSQEQAVLQRDRIVSISRRKISLLRLKNKGNKKLLKSLTQAMKALKGLQKQSRTSIQMYEKFSKMYELDPKKDEEDLRLINSLQNYMAAPPKTSQSKQKDPSIEGNMYTRIKQRKQHKRKRLAIRNIVELSIYIQAVNSDTLETRVVTQNIFQVTYSKLQEFHKKKIKKSNLNVSADKKGIHEAEALSLNRQTNDI